MQNKCKEKVCNGIIDMTSVGNNLTKSNVKTGSANQDTLHTYCDMGA